MTGLFWRLLAAGLAASIVAGAARCEEFTGKTAAYIDWAVNNCDCKSTDHEHKLVEQANGNEKAHDAFQKSYLVQFQSKEFIDANADSKAKQDKCEAIKGWFGPTGERVSGLISWAKAPASSSSSSSSSTPAQGSGKRGRRQAQ